jgi:hypothetical protein
MTSLKALRLRRLLAAPELVVVNLVDRALHSLALALFSEYPLLDDPLAAPDDPPVRRRARALLRDSRRLRRRLRAFRRAVQRGLNEPHPDLPF